MVHGPRARATSADLLAAPPHLTAELIAGELFLQPRPAKPHTFTRALLGGELMRPFHLGRGGPGGWWIAAEPEVHLGEHVLVPDLAGWRRASLPDLDLAVADFEVAPDWVCEILSPSTQAHDRVRKLRVYGQAGVGFAWLIDPVAQTLEVLERIDGAWILAAVHGGDETVRARPFDAVELELPLLWVTQPEAR